MNDWNDWNGLNYWNVWNLPGMVRDVQEVAEELKMSNNDQRTIQVTCPCCDAILTIDPSLPAVLDYKFPAKPQVVAQM